MRQFKGKCTIVVHNLLLVPFRIPILILGHLLHGLTCPKVQQTRPRRALIPERTARSDPPEHRLRCRRRHHLSHNRLVIPLGPRPILHNARAGLKPLCQNQSRSGLSLRRRPFI